MGLSYYKLKRYIKMKRIYEKPHILTTALEEEDAKYIIDLAYENRLSVSQQIKDILEKYIERHKGNL